MCYRKLFPSPSSTFLNFCFRSRPTLFPHTSKSHRIKDIILNSHSNEEEQETQCTYNATVRRVSVTIVAVEKQCVLHILNVYFIALGIQHATRTRHNAMCGLYGCIRFLHIISKMAPFSKEKKSFTKHKMCYEFLHDYCLKHFSFEELREI
jgi:hypothetical protein